MANEFIIKKGFISKENSEISGSLNVSGSIFADNLSGSINYNDITNPPDLSIYVPYTGATSSVDLGENGLKTGFVTLDTTPTNTPTDQGTMFWDVDNNTIDVILNGYTMKLGEDQFYPVKNQTGVNIVKGTVVGFAGTLGVSGRLLIQPFIADGSLSSTFFMGVTAENINDGADGKVLWFGRIRGINTSMFSEGDILYASTTNAGQFQTTVPQSPNNIIQVAAVINSHPNNGVIFIRPTIGSDINNDEGVKIVNPQDGEALLYNSLTGLWENSALPNPNLATFTIDLIDELDVVFYAPYDLRINTLTNIVNNPTVTIEVNGSPYTLEDLITQGSEIKVIVDINGVVNLNVEYE